MAIQIEERGEGPAVLLLAGTAMDPSSWWPCVGRALVDAGFQAVVVHDRTQALTSDPPAEVSVATLAADVVEVVERADLAPVVVVGASLGGFVACEVLTTRPDLVRAAVLVASAGRPDALAVSAARVAGFAIRHRNGAPGVRAQQAASARWIADPTLDDRWARLSRPCLAVAFGRDPLFPPSAVREAVARMPDGRYAAIDGARHNGVVTHGEPLARTVVRFVAEPAPRP